ncbi:histidine phosphatase family protein [Pseudomonadota bacterium]|nr:histidine phosphatase family protein [Pseudomonadota bacterium]
MNNKTNNSELLLLRHGKSSPWDSVDGDFDRTLTEQGQRHVKRVALYLQQNNLIPDFILSSPAQRAFHTATIVCQSLGIDPDTIHVNNQIYNAQYEDLFNVITQCPQRSDRVLLVGHNPALEELVTFLSSNSTPQFTNQNHLSPSSLAHLQTEEEWSKLHSSGARILSVTHSKSLVEDSH